MYDYVDRPIADLHRGPQLLVWAMRRWVRDRAAGICPSTEIDTAFHAYRLDCALPFFHLVMTALCTSMREELMPGAAEVSEHEALVLALIHALPRYSASHASDIAGRIVHLEAAPHFADALRQLALRLFARDLLCATPEHRSGARTHGRDSANDMGNA